MRAYKFRVYPTHKQLRELDKHLGISKNLWNELLSHNKQMYQNYGYFATKNTMRCCFRQFFRFLGLHDLANSITNVRVGEKIIGCVDYEKIPIVANEEIREKAELNLRDKMNPQFRKIKSYQTASQLKKKYF